jgi:hypothetical protein
VFDGSAKTIDVGNGAVTFVGSSVLTLAKGAVLTAYATLTDDEPVTLTAGATDSTDDVVLTNKANSVATLDAGVLTLGAHVTNQATLEAKGAGAIMVGGSTNSVTFTKALFTTGGGATASTHDIIFTGAGGLVDIGVGYDGSTGGSLKLADDGAIVTAGTGNLTVSTGLKIGGVATTVTSIDVSTIASKLSIFESTDTTAKLTINVSSSGDADDGIVIGTDSSPANNLSLLALDGAAAVYTFTKAVGGDAPVVISGTDIKAPASNADSAGAIITLTDKSHIVLGNGSIILGGIPTGRSSGGGKLVAAANGTIDGFTNTTPNDVNIATGQNLTGTDGNNGEVVSSFLTSNDGSGVFVLATKNVFGAKSGASTAVDGIISKSLALGQ